MATAKHEDWADNSQGIRPVPPDELKRIQRPHRDSGEHTPPLEPLEQPWPPRGRYTELRRIPRADPAPRDITKMETMHLGQRPLPNITPNYGPSSDGKREYELQLDQDLAHGGYHAMRATLGTSGGGVVQRETGAVQPTRTGLQYKNEIAHYHLAFEEMIQLACCACDARGMSWADACRFIEQTLRTMQERLPDHRPEGA